MRDCVRGIVLVMVVMIACVLLSPSAKAQSVPYEKYRLDNGLTVILHVDKTTPVAVVNLWYRVGAKEEPPGRSGFAHLFEHLMFMGTTRVPGSNFDTLMEAAGGSNNASTSLDRTNYFSSGPSSLLPTLLWLEADRLEDLGRAMTQEKLDKQRDVVRNEIRQNVELAPYVRADEAIYRLMYPAGHPYHEAVYGTHADLQAATVNDVKDFFGTFYVPRNCSLVVAGDFDPAVIKPLIEKLFGSLAAGAPVINRTSKDLAVSRPGRVVRSTVLDNVQQPRVSFVFHSPAHFADGDAEMDLIAGLLTQGKTSRLYKSLVLDSKLATDVSASQNSAALSSLLHIDVMAAQGADLDAIEKIVRDELEALKTTGPKADELARQQNTVELALLSRVDDLLAKADRLNEYEYAFGEPDSFKRDLERYRIATPETIKSWARTVFTPESHLVLRVLPQEPEKEASPRDERPGDLAASDFKVQMPTMVTLANGINVLVWTRPSLPIVSVGAIIRAGGPVHEPGTAGIGQLLADMLDEGAGDLNSAQFSEAVQTIGATFGAGASTDALNVNMTVLKRSWPQGAKLLADSLRRPRMDGADFERVKRLHLESLLQQLTEPQVIASRVGLRGLFGPAHPYGVPVGGTPASVEKLRIEDVQGLRMRLMTPGHVTLVVSGSIAPDEAKTTLDPILGDWSGPAAPAAASPVAAAIPDRSAMQVLLVNRTGATQTVLRFVHAAPAAAAAPRAPLQVVNTILGGSFTSRLNANLREAKGYTYGASSRFVFLPGAGYLVASTSVQAEVTGLALKEFLAELTRITSGDISADEITKATQTIRTQVIQDLAGVHGPVGLATQQLSMQLPFSSVQEDLNAAMAMTAAQANLQARSAIALDRGVLVLVGDRELILRQIKDLALPAPVEVEPDGSPVSPSTSRPAAKTAKE